MQVFIHLRKSLMISIPGRIPDPSHEVRNCFLMPIQSNAIVEKGVAKMNIFTSLGLQDIQIRQLPAKTMYDYYLRRRTMDVSALTL